MRMSKKPTLLASGLVLFLLLQIDARPQDNGFELPVELVGFPVIIGAVRLSNFVKKLAYSLNPNTYSGGRSKRHAIEGPATEATAPGEEELIDMQEAEKRLLEKFGERICVYKRTCLYYANRARANSGEKPQLDWQDILTQYKSSPDRNKEFHLLSVFLGDIVGSPKFCNLLAKRRSCQE